MKEPDASALRLIVRRGNTDVNDGVANNDASKPPLRSVHTTSFVDLLAEMGASVLVTTYQAGKLIVLRNDGRVLNTHFRDFSKPMGLADSSLLKNGTGTLTTFDILEGFNA